MTDRSIDLVYGTGLLVIAALLYWASFDVPVADETIANNPLWFPRLLLGLMLIAAVALGARALVRRSATTTAEPLRRKAVAITIGAAGAYLTGFHEIGFIPATLVLFPLMCWLLGYRRPLTIALVTLILTISLWYAFSLLLNVTPPGIGFPVPA